MPVDHKLNIFQPKYYFILLCFNIFIDVFLGKVVSRRVEIAQHNQRLRITLMIRKSHILRNP